MAKVFIGNIKGPQGEAGQQGTSISHSWDGTVLTVVSASGVSSVDLKGERARMEQPQLLVWIILQNLIKKP